MKRLYRSGRDRMIAGVAAGVAEYYGLDPTIVRLAWLAAAFAGVGVAVYIVAALIVPENPAHRTAQPAGTVPPHPSEPPTDSQKPFAPGGPDAGSRSFGYILIVVGVYLLVRRFVPSLHLGRLWPVALIALGAYLLTGEGRRAG